MKISFIVPVYNTEKFLKRCIDSIIDQKYQNIEVILINDVSSDKSGQICREYSKLDQRIKVIEKNSQQGVSAARNDGIKRATGDYIAFIDSDDFYINDNFLNEFVYKMQHSNADFFIFDYKEFYELDNKYIKHNTINKADVSGKQGVDALVSILSLNMAYNWYVWVYFIKKDLIINNNLFFEENRYYEDILWSPNIFFHAKEVEYINNYIYVYRRQREGSITANMNYKKFSDLLYLTEKWLEKLKDPLLPDNLKELLKINILNGYLGLLVSFNSIEKKSRSKALMDLKEKNYILALCGYYKMEKKVLINKKVAFMLCKTLGFSMGLNVYKLVNKLNLIIRKMRN